METISYAFTYLPRPSSQPDVVVTVAQELAEDVDSHYS